MEIVVILGYNAGGKSTLVAEYTSKGYVRINRDTTGGTLDGQVDYVHKAIHDGATKIVLDNTYMDKKSRASLIKYATDIKAIIRCVWLTTSFEDAQLNACLRMVKAKGKLLMPEDFKTEKNPNLFPPVALFNYKKHFEKPTTDEGFTVVEKVEFKRVWAPEFKEPALILDYDDTLRTCTGKEKFPCCPTEIKMLPGRAERIKKFMKDHKIKKLLGVSNQSGVAKGKLTMEDAKKCFDHTNKELGLDIEYYFCPHNVPPVNCYCRKPHPGIGALLIVKHNLLPEKCVFVGDQTTDKTFAERCGFQYQDVGEFFNGC